MKKNIVIYKTKTKINNEIKNKIFNDIKLKKANIKAIFTHKYRTNNNSKKDLDKNINKKNDLKNSSSSLNKENHIIINNIYNINILPTNNIIKKEIIITKDPNSANVSNANNKTIVKSLQNCHTDENLISKSENKKVLVNNNKININNLNININKIINKNSLTINKKLNNNYNKKIEYL